MTTRRQFLRASAVAAGYIGWPTRSALGSTIHLPSTRAARRLTASAVLPDAPDPTILQQLARTAVDAARAAGAEFADVRIGVQRALRVPTLPSGVSVEQVVSYGVRARVSGTWGFQYGTIPTSDAIAIAARSATAGARRYAAANAALRVPRGADLAPAQPVQGEWRTPVEIDPFNVPIDDVYRIIGSLYESTAVIHRNRPISSNGISWYAETRVFASSDGSLVTQHFMRGGHGVDGGARMPDNTTDFIMILLPDLIEQSGGLELMTRPDLVDYVLSGMEEVTRLREIPVRAFPDVGRFPVVFDGMTFASLVGNTLGLALDAERAAGLEADASGTTFLVPPLDIVQAAEPTFSPLLTVTSARRMPSSLAAQWDDEGVACRSATLVQDGRVVDYHTTRETAPLLAEWYAKQGRPVQSHGITVASRPSSIPVSGSGHLHVAPASSTANLMELAKDISHGFIVRGGTAEAESGLTLATIRGMNIEVRNGKPVARVPIMLQCGTKATFKKNLVALGDASTLLPTVARPSKGMPWEEVTSYITAPAAFCRDIDIVSWGLQQDE